MSQYDARQARQQACLNVVRQNLAGLEEVQDAIISGLTSTRLGELATMATALSPERTAALAHELTALPGLNLLPSTLTADLSAATSSLGTASATELPQVQQTLATALDRIETTVARTERLTVAETAAAVLPDLGYVITRADGAHATAFEARRGHETMLVVVSDGGRVQTDHLGLSDTSCQDRQNAFVDKMSDAGTDLTDEARIEHHDPRGGSLAAAAARESFGDLAGGAAAVADRTHQQAATERLHRKGGTTGTTRPTLHGGQR